jgi:hypothetical protein
MDDRILLSNLVKLIKRKKQLLESSNELIENNNSDKQEYETLIYIWNLIERYTLLNEMLKEDIQELFKEFWDLKDNKMPKFHDLEQMVLSQDNGEKI